MKIFFRIQTCKLVILQNSGHLRCPYINRGLTGCFLYNRDSGDYYIKACQVDSLQQEVHNSAFYRIGAQQNVIIQKRDQTSSQFGTYSIEYSIVGMILYITEAHHEAMLSAIRSCEGPLEGLSGSSFLCKYVDVYNVEC